MITNFGCCFDERNHDNLDVIDTFWTNPQYRVEVTDPDEDDDENSGTILIALMQKERRKKRQEGLDLLTMGYLVYPVSSLVLITNCHRRVSLSSNQLISTNDERALFIGLVIWS